MGADEEVTLARLETYRREPIDPRRMVDPEPGRRLGDPL
jgi:hypothetical protein